MSVNGSSADAFGRASGVQGTSPLAGAGAVPQCCLSLLARATRRANRARAALSRTSLPRSSFRLRADRRRSAWPGSPRTRLAYRIRSRAFASHRSSDGGLQRERALVVDALELHQLQHPRIRERRWRQGLNRSDLSQMEIASFFEWASMPITNRGSSSVLRRRSCLFALIVLPYGCCRVLE